MSPHVALLRGINVGGGNRLQMADLRQLATDLGWQDPQTYVASGNLVFRAPAGDHGTDLSGAIKHRLGLSLPVLVLQAQRFRSIAAACPFSPKVGKHAHVFFAFARPHLDQVRLAELKAPSETLVAGPGALYLLAPDGIERSALAQNLHKVVSGPQMTGRNLNTVRKILDMLDAA